LLQSRRQSGFTLIELLIVISVVGILVALLLPAVQAARGAARQMSCRNNLKQIGLALHNYESTFSSFPPTFCTTPLQNAQGTGASWSIHGRLLPFIEQGNAARRVDLDVDWHDQVATGVTFMHVPGYLCPGEPNDHYRMKDGKPYVAPHTYGFNLTYSAITSRSHHLGLVHIVLMDGSVRAVSDSMDLTVWRALGSRQGREVVGDY
jgi:prepilin-type N-terminal cleavage/methylation domain-containing protein